MAEINGDYAALFEPLKLNFLARITGQFTFAITLWLALSATGGLTAANLELSGNLKFDINHGSSTAVIRADIIKNLDNSGRSNAIRLELWAFTTPYAGGALNGYRLADYQLGTLAAGASLTSVSSGTVGYTAPPAGTYYLSMMLTEYTGYSSNDGYFGRDYGNLSSQLVVEAGSTGGGAGNLRLGGTMT